jgi:glycosyltransferase involved in cell wall biosynthesis
MNKLVRITTVPISLEKLLEGQLTFLNDYYKITAVSAEKTRLDKFGIDNKVDTFWLEMTRAITPIQDLKAVYKLYKYFLKEKPEIVHTHTPKAGIVGMLAAKMAGVPIRLHTVAGLPLLETTGIKRRILNAVESFTYSLATKVYPNSYGLKRIILDANFARENKLKVLGVGSSNGIDTQYFNPENFSVEFQTGLRATLNIPQDHLVFIFIGRLVSEKGINELVAAFSELYEKNSSVSLLLVGPFEQELDPLSVETLKLIKTHSGIISVGFQQDVRPYLSISDVFTFPSYREGFPNVVMQAGAMGIPSIVSDINGCNEIIKEEVNGLIIEAKNKEALKSSMYRFIADRELSEKLGKCSRNVITSKYERKAFWQILLKEYKSLEDIYIR